MHSRYMCGDRCHSASYTLLSVAELPASEAAALIAEENVAEGMIPKLESCIQAVAGGVEHAHLIDGHTPHALLMGLFTAAGIGMMISAKKTNGCAAHGQGARKVLPCLDDLSAYSIMAMVRAASSGLTTNSVPFVRCAAMFL